MIVDRRGMGFDPVTVATAASVAVPILDKIFGVSSAPAGPSPQQLALLQQQQAAAAATTQRWLMVGGALAAIGLVVALRR